MTIEERLAKANERFYRITAEKWINPKLISAGKFYSARYLLSIFPLYWNSHLENRLWKTVKL